MKNDWAIHIPWVMGLIGTRSLDKELPGLKDILVVNRERVVVGVEAVKLLEALRADPKDAALREAASTR
jgi:cytochrome d ubiquinol oxidase subunit I